MARVKLFLCLTFLATSVTAQVYTPKFDLQGHRGARGLMPENTIPAFLKALDYGVTTIELDLAVTKDGQLVVSHEPYMSGEICLAPDGQPIDSKKEKEFNIYEMTYNQVRQFDCGLKVNDRFPAQQKMNATKPLLRDVIVAVEDYIRSYTQYEVDYNIEIKSSPDGDNQFHPTPEVFSDLVYNLLNDYLPMERVVIQSFDFRVLKYWNKKYPQVRLAALIENMKPVSTNLANLGFKPAIYSPHYKLLTKQKIDYLHDRKIRVIPWTVNEPDDMTKMKEWKVDGIITDYPDRAAVLGMGIRKPSPENPQIAH